MLRNNYYKILYRKYKPTARHTLNLSFKREGDCFLIRLRSLRFSSLISRRNSLSSFPLYNTFPEESRPYNYDIISRTKDRCTRVRARNFEFRRIKKFLHKPRDTVKRVYGSRHAVDTLRINRVPIPPRDFREISC